MGKEYTAENIKVLSGIEAVRQRPAMYIGDTGTRGMHHLVFEAIDNGVDEALAGYCRNVDVEIHEDGSVSVTDDGRGIPVGIHKEIGKSALEVVMTTLHAGAKFDREGYRVSGGLHGVGISCTNALSEWLEAEIRRDGHIWFQKYERGAPMCEVKQLGDTKRTGSRISFKPDAEIFGAEEFKYEVLSVRLRELSFLTPGVRFRIVDERADPSKEEIFCHEEGLKAFVRLLDEGRKPLHEDVYHFEGESGDVLVECALQYHDGYNEGVFAFANNIRTEAGGTHVSGFKSALTRVVNLYAKREKLLKDKSPPSGDDVREGLTAVISVKLPTPQFEGQTKAKLGNPEMEGIVESVCYEHLLRFLDTKPAVAKAIIQKALQATAARDAARKARDLARRKGALSSGNLPGKLADCQSKEVEQTELFLVEGVSAGGSAISGRDRRFQAILPLQGKILNVEKARLDKVLAHRDISTVIAALGTNVSTDYDEKGLRYGKVIIMTDADVDGSHIRTLLLTFFFRNMPELVEAGRLYVGQPPLFRVKRKKKERYVTTEEEMHTLLLDLGLEGAKLEVAEPARTLEGAELVKLVGALERLERLSAGLRRKGVSAARYLRLARDGVFPSYRVTHGAEEFFFYSEDELAEFLKGRPSAELEDEPAHEREGAEDADAEAAKGGSSEPHLVQQELFESREIKKALAALDGFGFGVEDYLGRAEELAPGEEAAARFALVCGGDTRDFDALAQAVARARELGRKGLDIQRYKGLGEMNPSQLWETTMDPERRTLRRVRVEDAVNADQMFGLLMGEEVRPRRNFIEKHALEITNLDV